MRRSMPISRKLPFFDGLENVSESVVAASAKRNNISR
jgi:hypothetical protein